VRAIVFILAAAIAASGQDPKAAALGAQLARELRQRTTAIENPTVQDYIDRIGRKLAAQLPDANIVYQFALISDDAGGATHEPMSFPGGYIFVSASLIRDAASESELAGILAHAMFHAARPLPRSDSAQIPLVFIGGWQGLGPGRNGSLVPMSVLETQRDNETRADAVAVQAMSEAGYDPEALPSYLARVQPPAARSAKVFSALPDRDTRVAAIRQVIEELPARTYAPVDPDEFSRIQEQVRNTVQRLVPPAEDRTRPTLRRQN
jgi:predicted Zn-dependent protease